MGKMYTLLKSDTTNGVVLFLLAGISPAAYSYDSSAFDQSAYSTPTPGYGYTLPANNPASEPPAYNHSGQSYSVSSQSYPSATQSYQASSQNYSASGQTYSASGQTYSSEAYQTPRSSYNNGDHYSSGSGGYGQTGYGHPAAYGDGSTQGGYYNYWRMTAGCGVAWRGFL